MHGVVEKTRHGFLSHPIIRKYWDIVTVTLPLLNMSTKQQSKNYKLQKIRESSNVPVLMLTAKSDEEDKVSGLWMGADDYLTKPFGIKELMARVNSFIRRYTTLNSTAGTDADVMEFEGIVIDRANRVVWAKGMLVELTGKEFDLVAFLASNKGRVYTKKQIYTHVWEEHPGDGMRHPFRH